MNSEFKSKLIFFFQEHEQDFICALKRDLLIAKNTPFEIGLFNWQNKSIEDLEFQITGLLFLNEGLKITTQPLANIPHFGTPEYDENLNRFYAFENKCETDFWNIEKNTTHFEELATFNAFQDITVSPVQAKKYRTMLHLFDTEGWLEYVKKLLILFYPDFESIKINKKILLRHKGASDDKFNLYLECDTSLFKKNLGMGKLILPDIHVLLVNRHFDVDFEKGKQDIFSDVTALGKFSNPFIQEPCSPISTFFAQNTLLQLGPGDFKTINNMNYDHLENGDIHIYNSKDFGILLQKHLYFYFATNQYFAASYLDFLAKFKN